jgi:D-glycero-alpha-D-manno-heptose-7-phosphate kinase
MILTRTPLRTSFVGGGSDLPAFYERGDLGAVLSCSISAYVYVAVSRQFNPYLVRVSYSQTENVVRADDLSHDLIRESLNLLDIKQGIEINTIADVPGQGTGLGSSAAVTVGTLLALHQYSGRAYPHADTLASMATNIEMSRLKKPIGKQDQYAVAHGGFNEIRFLPDRSVDVERLNLPASVGQKVNRHLCLYYTGQARASGPVLADVQDNLYENDKVRATTRKLAAMVPETSGALQEGRMDKFGYLLHEAWQYKKQMSHRITNKAIDRMYEKALKAGAYGGKLLGAGSGGFLLLVVPPNRKDPVNRALQREPINVGFGVPGAMIIFDDGRESHGVAGNNHLPANL